MSGLEGGLRVATSRDRGATWSPVTTIDFHTCQCCWNKAMAGEDGRVYALYGDRTPRDVALVVREQCGAWRRAATVGAFNWDIELCPHVGGGLALSGAAAGVLRAIVWTGEENQVGVYVLRSAGAGRTWLPPHRLGTDWAKNGGIGAVGPLLGALWDDRDGDSRVSSARSRAIKARRGPLPRGYRRRWHEQATPSW